MEEGTQQHPGSYREHIYCLPNRGDFSGIVEEGDFGPHSQGTRGVSGEIKARPICLLDELGKTFERVIAD